MKEKTLKWLKAAGIRALKTAAQTAIATIGVSALMEDVNWWAVGSTAIATIGVSALMEDVNWWAVGSTALLAAILSLLTSLGGLPELKEEDDARHAKHFEDD